MGIQQSLRGVQAQRVAYLCPVIAIANTQATPIKITLTKCSFAIQLKRGEQGVLEVD